MRKSGLATLIAALGLSAGAALAEDPPPQQQPEGAPAPDNTGRNAERRTPTADEAVDSASDRELTAKIRQALMDDDSLSMNAHNAKVIVKQGTVTLAGPVASDSERAKVEQIAGRIAGGDKVVNRLEVLK